MPLKTQRVEKRVVKTAPIAVNKISKQKACSRGNERDTIEIRPRFSY
jgi:hypothetical protein